MLKSLIDRIINQISYFPADTIDSAVGDIDDIDVLENDKDDDKEESDKEDKDNKSDDDVSEDDDKADDEESEEEPEETDDDEKETDDDEDETEEDQIPSVKDIKKDYPDFFKKHPEVKAAIFRDQRFSEIIGTVDDAEKAVVKANALNAIENDLFVNHDASKLLATLKKEDPNAYKNTLYKLLPDIQEKDKELYLELAALPIKQLLRSAWSQGKGDKTNLGKAAYFIHEFFFGEKSRFEDKVQSEDLKPAEKSTAQKEYEERLAKLDERAYTEFKGSVDESYVKQMDNFIRETLDKDTRLSEFTKKNIVRETLEEINSQLSQDTRYNTSLNALWQNAKSAGFTKDFKSRIITTALARAKSLAPVIRAKLMKEALGQSKNTDKKDDKKKEVIHSREKRDSGRDSGRDRIPSSGKFKSDLDILKER